MINAIPIFGWLLSAFGAMSLSVPFYFLWNALAPTYFYWLPKVYLRLPFWHCVGLFMLASMLRLLSPVVVRQSNTNTNKTERS